VSIDTHDDEGLTPLRRALYGGNEEIAAVILARGPSLDVFDAAALGDVHALKRTLGKSARRVNASSQDGFTPLHLAAYFGRLDAVELLLDRGANIEARSTNPRLRDVTPLHSAAAGRQTEVAILLLDRGADPNAVQPGGWTPLHQAAANGDLALCKALLKHRAKRAPLSDDRSRPIDFAIEHHHQEIVRLLKPRT
jgi:ankyrin repeat protein